MTSALPELALEPDFAGVWTTEGVPITVGGVPMNRLFTKPVRLLRGVLGTGVPTVLMPAAAIGVAGEAGVAGA